MLLHVVLLNSTVKLFGFYQGPIIMTIKNEENSHFVFEYKIGIIFTNIDKGSFVVVTK